MSYDVGQYIDLGHLNGGATKAAPKSEASAAYEVGTHFTFQFGQGQIKAARSIPVVYA